MTEPQRHKLVVSSAVTVLVCLIGYVMIFGFHSFDAKALIVMAGFFGMAWKISTIKKKQSPLI
ncbi:MAG TPA: hypothetical protein PLO78_04860 [Candidatus Omnitrophota bacterium]|nr:hypothetical protein [Candidatus Omnitrophota bacterium]